MSTTLQADYTTDVDYQGLMRGILENPADDAPRLILSDWLEEHGEEERAVRIRRAIENPEPSKCSFVSRRGVMQISSRGFISEVRLACAEFCGGTCPECGGRGERRVEERGEYGPNIYQEDCYLCRGTGRIEGVAMALFERHPLTKVVLTCRKPNYHDWRDPEHANHYYWLSAQNFARSDTLPKELRKYLKPDDLTCGGQWFGYKSEATALDALSDAAVAYGRNLVCLPPLEPS